LALWIRFARRERRWSSSPSESSFSEISLEESPVRFRFRRFRVRRLEFDTTLNS
jgi:hypothetical protein